MAFCPKCGAQLAENANFCPVCGASVNGNRQQSNQTFQQNVNVDNDKVMGVLSYIGILVLVPIFAAPNSRFARFHANQGLILFIIEAALGIIQGLLMAIFAFEIFFVLRAIISAVFGIVWLATTGLSIYGIVNAATGAEKELPVIGKIRILK